jgi:cytoskeletal protein RodZ
MSEDAGSKNVGLILKEARMAKSLSLEQASKDTKVHLNILKKIEADEIGSLGLVYAKSFLRIYAEYLGLNKEDIVRRFEGPSAGASSRPVLPQASAAAPIVKFVPEKPHAKDRPDVSSAFADGIKKIDFRRVLLGIVVLFVVVAMVKFVRHRGSTTRVVKKANEVGVKVKKTPAKKQNVSLPSAGAQEPKSAPLLKPVVSKEGEKVVLTVKAKTKNWLQVKVDGKVVFQSIMARGRAEMWQAKEKIELWLGDAGAVQLELNGRLLEKIGRPGQTLKHVVVTKAGFSIQK